MLRTVKIGDTVRWECKDFVVSAAKAGLCRLTPVQGGPVVWVDIYSMAGDPDFEIRTQTRRARSNSERLQLLSLTPDEQEHVLWWRDHIMEVEHGVTDPSDPDARPRPGYDNPSVTARRELKVDELHAAGIRESVSVSSLRRKAQKYADEGLFGLLDKRANRDSGLPQVDERIEKAVIDVLANMTERSTVAVTVLMNQVKVFVQRQYPDAEVEWPSDRTLRRLIEAYDHRGRARGPAATRRSEANRPDRQFRPVAAYYPGQFVEADSSPFNFPVLNPDGRERRSRLHIMIDLATRSIVAWAITPTDAKGYDLSLMLARALRPRTVRRSMPKHTWMTQSPVLPHAHLAALDEEFEHALAIPFIVPETITTDQGKDYRSNNFVESCRLFGISVIPNPPGSPTAKPKVERLMKTVETSFMQYIEGYLGNAVHNRGRRLSEQPLKFDELDDLFAEWVVIYQNTPHPALRDRTDPSRIFTPNQMYARYFDATGGVKVPIDEDSYISLMPRQQRKVQSDGIHLNRQTYDSASLNDLRGHAGRQTIAIDPYDTDRIWLLHPETDEWVECHNTRLRDLDVPYGSDRPEVADSEAYSAEEFQQRQLHRRHDKELASRQTRVSRSPKKRRAESCEATPGTPIRHGETLRPAPIRKNPPTAPPLPMRPAGSFQGGFDYKEAWDA